MLGAGRAYLDFEEVLGRAVDLVEALLARVGHGLHEGSVQAGALRRRAARRVGAGGPPGILRARQFGGCGEERGLVVRMAEGGGRDAMRGVYISRLVVVGMSSWQSLVESARAVAGWTKEGV